MANQSADFKLELYRQSWEQSRHNEQLRGAYSAWVAAIVFGALTFSRGEPNTLHWLLVLLAGLTFSSFMVSLRTWFTTRRWLVTQVRIQRELKLGQYIVPVQRTFSKHRGWSTILHLTYVSTRFDMTYILLHGVATIIFVAAYLMDFSFSEGLNLHNLSALDIAVLAVIFLVIVVLWIFFYRLVKPFEEQIQGGTSNASL